MNKIARVPQLRFPEFGGGWDSKLFSDIVSVIDGDRGANYPKSNDFFNNEYCLFLSAKNVTKNGFVFDETQFITNECDELLRKGKLNRYDVVLTTRGTVGQFAFYSDDVLYDNIRINSGMVLLRNGSNNLLSNYFFKACNSFEIAKQIKIVAFGSAQPQLTVKEINKIKINLPSIPEQTKIANFLSSIDTKIEQLSKKQALLDEYKKGLMQKIFSQALRFKADDGSDYPDWEEKKLGDVGQIITGKTPSTNNLELWDGDILFITPTDIIEESKYQISTQRTITKQINTKLLPIGSIVYTCIASIGKMAITTNISSTNQQINSIITKDNINNEYVYYALLNMTPYIKSTQATSTLPIINKTEFLGFKINIPLLPEQTKIANFLSSIDTKIEQVGKQLREFKQFKKALLQQMFV